MLSGIVDTLMIAKLGGGTVGSVGTANTYIDMFFILFSVMSCGFNNALQHTSTSIKK